MNRTIVMTEDRALQENTDTTGKVVQAILESYRDEYKDCVDTWRDLERKAQGAIAVAGIFLAAVFAFIRQLGDEPNLIKALLAIALLVLGVSIAYALAALVITQIIMPPGGDHLKKLMDDLTGSEENGISEERYVGFIYDQISSWKESVSSYENVIKNKGAYVWIAQCLLITSIYIIALISILEIIF